MPCWSALTSTWWSDVHCAKHADLTRLDEACWSDVAWHDVLIWLALTRYWEYAKVLIKEREFLSTAHGYIGCTAIRIMSCHIAFPSEQITSNFTKILTQQACKIYRQRELAGLLVGSLSLMHAGTYLLHAGDFQCRLLLFRVPRQTLNEMCALTQSWAQACLDIQGNKWIICCYLRIPSHFDSHIVCVCVYVWECAFDIIPSHFDFNCFDCKCVPSSNMNQSHCTYAACLHSTPKSACCVVFFCDAEYIIGFSTML